MRVHSSDPHHCVWQLALSVAPVVLRYRAAQKAEPPAELTDASAGMAPDLSNEATPRGKARVKMGSDPAENDFVAWRKDSQFIEIIGVIPSTPAGAPNPLHHEN